MRLARPMKLSAALALAAAACASAARPAGAQVIDPNVDPSLPPPPVTYRGLVAGVDTLQKVRDTLGAPFLETKWYSYKFYYPSQRGKDLPDVFQLDGNQPGTPIGDIEACSVPEGLETAEKIVAKLGQPEFELRMPTWRMLDYASKGLRFSLAADGKTTGLAYFSQGLPRVHEGARRFVDLTALRQGPQPKPASPAAPKGLMAGTAEVVHSPTDPSWLKTPFKIHDDLKDRIVVLSDGKLSVALVGADIFGMGGQDFTPVRAAAAEMGVQNVVVGMSHNHAAGDTIGVYGFYPAEYVHHIQERIIEGIKQAKANLKPVKELRTASKELPVNGARVVGLFRNARNPGVIDPTISILQPIGEDGKPIATIVNFACHVESLDYTPLEMSADFPGYMCEQMKKDGMGQPVFLNGAVGGMVSGDNEARTHESSMKMGLELARIVGELAKVAQPPAEFKFAAQTKRLELPVTNPQFKLLTKRKEMSRPVVAGRVVTDMQYIQLGEAQIVSIPGELLPEVSYEVLERMKGFPRVLVGLANDELGYMIPPEDFREKSYEESMSQGPATSLMVRDTAIRMIEGAR